MTHAHLLEEVDLESYVVPITFFREEVGRREPSEASADYCDFDSSRHASW